MPDFKLDLNNCNREPIHIPGQVQSHGFLFAIDQQHIIKFHSDNLVEFIPGIKPFIIGESIEYLQRFITHRHDEQFIISHLINIGNASGFDQVNPYLIDILGLQWYLIICQTEDLLLLEFEPAALPDEPDIQGMVGSSIAKMLANKTLPDLLRNTASQVRKVIGYDRVMVYRFADDGHGEVVAESKNDELETWLGLHYPASDIPKQARALYKLNLTRLISDVHSDTSKILTDSSNHTNLDLTYAQLRAVSPIHIQYLKNMGVASSFSISILSKGELWGLIACHNYTPKFINFKSRSSARLIGQILSSAFEFRQEEENQHAQDIFNSNIEKLSKSISEYDHIDEALTLTKEGNLLNVVHATGAVVVYEDRITHLGNTPDDKLILQIGKLVHARLANPLYYTDNLKDILPEAGAYLENASGILFCSLSKELNEFIIWFKPEVLYTVNWAGNPENPIETGGVDLAHISPRNSFAVWSETVLGRSESWKSEEIKSVLKLKEEISYAIVQKASVIRVLNEKLRLAYEELDTFSYTISHDLKNSLSIIKSYAQLIKRDDSLSERSHSYAARIEERTEKMNDMIKEVLDYSRIGRIELFYSPINMTELISEVVSDLMDIYGEQTSFVIGDLPDLMGDPLMIRQVFSNLVGNAVKYSQSATPPVIGIRGMKTGEQVSYTISDNGMGIPEEHLSAVFDLFKRVENVMHIEGSGVGLAIVKRILDKHKATIEVESQQGEGSTFHISFS